MALVIRRSLEVTRVQGADDETVLAAVLRKRDQALRETEQMNTAIAYTLVAVNTLDSAQRDATDLREASDVVMEIWLGVLAEQVDGTVNAKTFGAYLGEALGVPASDVLNIAEAAWNATNGQAQVLDRLL